MSKSAHVRLADLRAIHDLTHECRDLGDDHARWHEHWLRGLGRLVGAEFAVGGDVTVRPDGRVVAVNTVVWGWENGFDREAFHRALAEHDAEVSQSPLIAAYFRRRDGADGAGVTRPDLLPDREWYPTAYYAGIQSAIGIDHSLVSFRNTPNQTDMVSCLCLTRGADVRADFDPRHRSLAAEAQRVIAPLLGGVLARFTEPSPAALPLRMRQVLRCLLEGDGDKQVAARLGLSPHTVNQYLKTIFAHFGVVTRTELLASWVKRGWGGRCAWADE